MSNQSNNSFDLIGKSASKLAGKRGKAFLGSFFYLLPTLGICAVPYVGWAIGIILFGFLTPGYINFIQLLMKGEDAKYDLIFRGKGDIIASIFLGITLAAGMIVGTALAIVPGMFFATYYSMSFFFLNEDEITSAFGSMKNCSKNMTGYATNLFSYKVIFYIYYVIITLVCAAFGFVIWAFASILWVAVILYVVLALAFILLTSLCTMYFYAANCVFYEEVIAYQEVKKTRKRAKIQKEVKTEEAPAQEAPAKETPAEEVKTEAPAVKKPAVKKAAAPKTATTKAPAKTTKAAAPKTATKTAVKKEAVKK